MFKRFILLYLLILATPMTAAGGATYAARDTCDSDPSTYAQDVALQGAKGSTARLPAGRHIAALYNRGRFRQSLSAYKRLAGKGDIEGYLNLAVIFKDFADYEKAIAMLKKARTVFGAEPRILALLGRLYYLNAQPDEAAGILKKIIETDPGNTDALITLGLCYKDKGDDDRAGRYFESAVAADAGNVVARLSLADLYYRRNNIAGAIRQYRAANLIDASITGIQKILGDLFYRMGNMREAYRVYNRILLSEPSNQLAKRRFQETGDRLGREFFLKERAKKYKERSLKTVTVAPFPPVKDIAAVRVGIMRGAHEIEFKCSSPFLARLKGGKDVVMTGREGGNYRLLRNAGKGVIITAPGGENTIVNDTVMIKPLKAGSVLTIFNVKTGEGGFWSNMADRSYRGSLEVMRGTDGLTAVNIVNLEEYLYSVVPSEMPPEWPAEALKTQAVCARSEAFSKFGRHRKEGFDFCSEVHCQSYGGVEQEREASNAAVDDTRGIVMMYEGKPVDAVYSSTCGGHTQTNIFGGDMPYARAVYDGDDGGALKFPLSPLSFEQWLKNPPRGIYCDAGDGSPSSNFRWVRIYTVKEMNELIAPSTHAPALAGGICSSTGSPSLEPSRAQSRDSGCRPEGAKESGVPGLPGGLHRQGNIGGVRGIIALRRQDSGHIKKLNIRGARGDYVVEKELTIRRLLGDLRSSMFKVEVKYKNRGEPEYFILYGAGWGHGSGMCQNGAWGMSRIGKNYKQILRHYFRGIEFKKIY